MSDGLTEQARADRAFRDRVSDSRRDANAALIAREELHWGAWQVPDSELGILGGVAARDVLELGGGAAQGGIPLARAGARVVGRGDAAGRRDEAFEFPYGSWIRVFREAGLAVQAPGEVRPRKGAASRDRGAAEPTSADRRPKEQVWKARTGAA